MFLKSYFLNLFKNLFKFFSFIGKLLLKNAFNIFFNCLIKFSLSASMYIEIINPINKVINLLKVLGKERLIKWNSNGRIRFYNVQE